MTASPIDLTDHMVAIEQHWRDGQRLRVTGQFSEAEWSEHEAISMSALILLGLDGMKRLGKRCLLEGSVVEPSVKASLFQKSPEDDAPPQGVEGITLQRHSTDVPWRVSMAII